MSKIEVSDRKRKANQINALKSTGPKTIEGKNKSRLNAVTHGLRAETVVLPHEDLAAFEAERLGWIEDWKPESQTRMALIERAVVESWRLRRCVRVETVRLTKIVGAAGVEYDQALNARLVRGLRLLATRPTEGLEALGNDPTGINVLINAWMELYETVLKGPAGWIDHETHHGRLMNLLGHGMFDSPELINEGAEASYRLLRSNLGDLTEDEAVSEDEALSLASSLATWFKNRADALIQSLDEYIDPAAIRSRALDAACVDVSPEGLAHHRYEMSHDRAFKSTVNQLIQMAKTGSDLIAPNEATDDANACDIPACEPDAQPVSEPKPPRDPEPTPISRNEPTDDAPRASDRDRDGRIWGVEDGDPGLIDQ